MPPTEALLRLLDALACPVCSGPVEVAVGSLRCGAGHTFDVARQGYVNLLGRAAPRNADTADMVAARDEFLARGHYLPILSAVSDAVGDARRVLEVGAGTGWYTSGVLAALPGAVGLATDVSVPASRRAARAHPRLAAVVADTWAGLPLADGSFDAVLCVFAPRNAAEFSRVLTPGGRLVVATPGPEHLRELREAHDLLDIGADKVESLREAFAGTFTHGNSTDVREQMSLSDDEAASLVAMGPNAFHATTSPVRGGTVTLDVVVTSWSKDS